MLIKHLIILLLITWCVFPDTIPEGNLSILGVTILKSTLNEVQDKFGKAYVLKEKEHAPNVICYCSDDSSDNTALIFKSGAMGGWTTITQFELVASITDLYKNEFLKKIRTVSSNISTA